MPTGDNRKRITERLRPYKGFVFRWQPYKELAPDWDHDHCNGCWARFAERPGDWNDTVHTEGWVTLWPVKITRQQEEEQVAKWRAEGRDFRTKASMPAASVPVGCGVHLKHFRRGRLAR